MKKIGLVGIVCLLLVLLPSTAGAHELWIEVDYMTADNELRVDVSWGHIRDFYDPASSENFSAFVRYPDGQEEELELEQAGVQGRAFVSLRGEGEYVVWAVRAPGTHTPGDGISRLSIQKAKAVFVLGDGPATSTQPTDLPFEIIPTEDILSITTGTFSAQALLDGEPVAGATVSAYGPNQAVLTSETAADGTFSLNIPADGTWLVKTSFEVDEEGTLGENNYEKVGRTTTLVFTIDDAEVPAPNMAPAAGGNNTNTILALISGIFLGAAAALVLVPKKKAA